jgi:hypothetical protein
MQRCKVDDIEETKSRHERYKCQKKWQKELRIGRQVGKDSSEE